MYFPNLTSPTKSRQIPCLLRASSLFARNVESAPIYRRELSVDPNLL